jgi:hypothetical protein
MANFTMRTLTVMNFGVDRKFALIVEFCKETVRMHHSGFGASLIS